MVANKIDQTTRSDQILKIQCEIANELVQLEDCWLVAEYKNGLCSCVTR